MAKKKQSELPLSQKPSQAEVSPDSSPAADKADIHFERAVERLNEIVDRMESEELALEDSLKLFEEGVGLARHAQRALDRAEKRVEELLAFDDAGNPVVQELDPE